MNFGVVIYDREKNRRFIREQQAYRDHQILEWHRQLQSNPWLKEICPGRFTQDEINAAIKRQPKDQFDWAKEGF